jgi:signal transduction histidine kinase
LNREVALTIVIVASVIASITTILCLYTNNEIKRLDDEIIKTKSNEVQLLSSRFELRIQYITGIIELASQTYPLTEPPSSLSLISDQLKGIPQDADPTKREFARHLLEKKFDFDYVFYAVPNGDIYFLEPFQSQIKLSQLNFAFRDWYNGVVNTGATYVSEVYVSANEKHNVVGISAPIRSDVGDSMNGIFVGALNLGTLQESLASVALGKNEYLLIVDHNGNIVADSRKSESDTQIRKFSLDFAQSNADEINTSVQEIDGVKMLVVSKTMPIGTHKWLVLSAQPYSDAFASSISLQNETVLMLLSTVLSIGVAGFFLIRKINTNMLLTARLRRVDVEKEEFSAMVTHELKTPLVPIIGYCKMFKTTMLGKLTDEQLNVLDVIERNAKRLERLISDIMDVRKLDLDKIRFDMTDVSVDEFFDDLRTSYEQVLSQSGKKFVTDVQTKGLHLQTDRNRLRQCFDNLISNAIKFTPEVDGKITVGCRSENEKIIFYVADNGPGISPEAQQYLFKKFYQIDTSERRKTGGSGLGLAICKGIVEKLGGRIWVKSDGKTGSFFYMEFTH